MSKCERDFNATPHTDAEDFDPDAGFQNQGDEWAGEDEGLDTEVGLASDYSISDIRKTCDKENNFYNHMSNFPMFYLNTLLYIDIISICLLHYRH